MVTHKNTQPLLIKKHTVLYMAHKNLKLCNTSVHLSMDKIKWHI